MSKIEPILKEIQPMTVAYIKMKGHFSQIPTAFNTLYGWIAEKGYRPYGPAITVYYNIPGQVSDDELQWELRSQILEKIGKDSLINEGLGVKHLETNYVVSVMHKGSYEKLEETYQSLSLWIDNNRHIVDSPPEELYYNSPEKVQTTELITEIRFPIRRKS